MYNFKCNLNHLIKYNNILLENMEHYTILMQILIIIRNISLYPISTFSITLELIHKKLHHLVELGYVAPRDRKHPPQKKHSFLYRSGLWVGTACL